MEYKSLALTVLGMDALMFSFCLREDGSLLKEYSNRDVVLDIVTTCAAHMSDFQAVKEDAVSSSCQGDTVDLRTGQWGEEIEFDVETDRNMADSFSRAAAHGPNAPRAP